MDQHIFQNCSEEERREMLEDNAASITTGKYHRRFAPEEKNQRRKRVCEIDIALQELEEENAAFKAEMKMRKEPLVEEKAQLLSEIKSNGKFMDGKLYKIVDREKHEVGFYNEDGDLVEQRRMTKEDNQLDMSDAFRQAANL